MREKTENSVEVFVKAKELLDSGESFAIALVLNAEGSTPRKEGARAIITNTGKLFGTIGGGAIECETQRLAVESCKSKKSVIFDFELQGLDREGDTPICGGKMRILIDPISVQHKNIFSQIAETIKQRNKGIFLTTIKYLQIEYKWISCDSINSNIDFPGEEEINLCLEHKQPELFIQNKGAKEVFVEPIIPRPLLVIAGGGHIGQALAIQASLVGFDILVLDDRSEFTNRELFPKDTKTICDDIAQELSKIPAQKDTYIVIVTRGHKDDAQALEECINKPFTYIGMIGSKRKVAMIRDSLIQSGVCSTEQFEKVFSPIGLNIGALSVPEIATSITAELIAVRRMGITHKPWTDKETL
ncbi:MAG: XdhC family protein [Sedimentisphaerales bacterium]|nr:XdhC family protein [Sedimentisphaerales bacterium]